MKTVLPGLHVTANEKLPFSETMGMFSFLVEREDGNILVYGSTTVEGEEGAVRDLGGAWRQYLGHGHEAWAEGEEGPRFRGDLGIPVFAHEDDDPEISEYYVLDGKFSERHRVGDDFVVIPLPGHTPGSVAYLWDSGEHRVLFTSDTLFIREGEWTTALLDDSDREKYIQSLELIRDLDFDVLAPWIATVGGDQVAFTDRDDIVRRLEPLIEEMREK